MEQEQQNQTLSTGRRLWMAILLGSLAAFGPLTVDMYLPGFPSIAQDLQTNASLVQLSLTACLLGLASGQLVIGPISDMKGRRKPLLAALLTYFAASLLCVLAPSIWILILGRFIQGFAASAGIVISRAVVRDLYSGKELTKFFALLMLVNGLAPILAPASGGIVLNYTTWEGIFVLLSVVGIIMFITVLVALPETLTEENRSQTGIKKTILTFGDLIKDKPFLGYSLAQGLIMGGVFAYISGSPFVFQGIYGLSEQAFGFLLAFNGLGIIIGSQTTGRLAGIVAERKLLLFGLIMTSSASTFLMVMTVIEAPVIFLIVPLFLIVTSVGFVNTTSFSLAMATQGHRAGSAAALLGLLPFVLGSITAPLVGIAGESTAVPMGVIIMMTNIAALSANLLLVRQR
ncbi:multidrug effflux MFS transporter [Alteribacillus iranensis]|uniref:Bcr/CflA family efflux transporter n=1 Tax=Alteribacillus iranensis TaxID=930128 RepID=A0A1I2C1F5_9BACI|nr:multidrug effflux MFS transporter [Alteribacillus iranensis]SFE62286.1 MFS transporter, DHA1 family, bicyclomycin/chloramphenicol resistance protein [Alteribacillus iranensis]